MKSILFIAFVLFVSLLMQKAFTGNPESKTAKVKIGKINIADKEVKSLQKKVDEVHHDRKHC